MSMTLASVFHRPTYSGAGQELKAILYCDACQDHEVLSLEQFEGRLSVNHAATGCPSRYHETHDFRTWAVKSPPDGKDLTDG